MQQAISAAQRKVDAVDRRIDAVRAEMCRVAGFDPEAFDYATDDGQMAARTAFHNAHRDCPGFEGIERSLYLRRADATDIRDNLLAKEARAAERREAREFRKRFEASRHECPTCGQLHYAA